METVHLTLTTESYGTCELCGEEILPQYAASSWLGNFHQGCFSDVMQCAPVPKLVKAAMLAFIQMGIVKAREEG